MSFPNVSDIIATTIENRSKKVADNVTKNNAILMKLEQGGRRRPVSGGRLIYEELSFAENGNAGWYSGYDLLPVAAQDVLSAAQFDFKQAACPVTISGLEMLQNSSKEAFVDLLEERLNVAESTMANLISGGLYSDGTGSGGKEITGLDAMLPLDPTTSGVYGGIDRDTWTFWRNKFRDDASLTLAGMNALWAQTVRGNDRPDLIMVDSTYWEAYVALLQANQRFTQAETGDSGFPTIKYMGTDMCLDGGIGGFCPAGTAFYLNSKYLSYRPHTQREFTSLSPNKRYAINQDAEVQIMAWAGNLTCKGAQFMARHDINA